MSAVEQINPCRQTNSSQILDKYWDGNTVQTLVIVVNLSDESLAVLTITAITTIIIHIDQSGCRMCVIDDNFYKFPLVYTHAQ